jgi:peptidoglycan hydrolase-like protein with peptidoglycan-binding domain
VRTISLAREDVFPSTEQLLGVQIRLNHLGFFAGDETGEPSELTDQAIASFKRSQSLGEDSVLDEKTRTALEKAYGG